MSKNTKIEWAHHTFNPWEGCQKVGPGCDHCYAETRNARFGGGVAINWGPGAPRRRTSPANWAQPLKWNAEAGRLGERHRVFCASLADVFDNAVQESWRLDLFWLIHQTPHLDWLLLTKRIANVRSMLANTIPTLDPMGEWPVPLPNVWIGATIVNQEEADRDIPKLLAVPAAKRFLSMEPLLGPVDLRCITAGEGELDALKPDTWEEALDQWRDSSDTWEEDFEDWYNTSIPGDGLSGPMHTKVDWVIVGGESGPGARPMHPEWARSLRDQCQAAGVPFLFKQWGEWMPINQMEEAKHSALYSSRIKAKPHETQDVIDDLYGRKCSTPSECMHLDGSIHGVTEPMAWIEGAMLTFKVGKKAAGRLLDGREWNEVPQ